ncbi:MAG: FAD-dependent oxidoreductase, partial [Patescibacteria group bacterium]
YIGKGVSYCVNCDGPLFKNKTVAVIGSGNSGFETAIFLTDLAKKVYILGMEEKARADKLLQEKAREKRIELITNISPKEIRGEKFVKSIIYQDLALKEDKVLDIDGVFIEIGSRPANSFLGNLVKCNQLKEVEINPKTGETATPGLFAAGDVSDIKYKQIIIAAGEGAKAAISAYRYLRNQR